MKSVAVRNYIVLRLIMTFSGVVMHDISENHCQSTVDPCDTRPAGVATGSSSALALVLYDEKILTVPDFYREERVLQFGEFTVRVSQNWRELGVAAVVWDAVGSGLLTLAVTITVT